MNSNHKGMTWLEVLVVIFVAVVVILCVGGPGSGTLTKGKMVGMMNNLRQLQLATRQMTIDNGTNGNPIQWTCSNTTPLSLEQFKRMLVPVYIQEEDLKTMVTFTEKTFFGGEHAVTNAITVYAVTGRDPDNTILASTANWHGVDKPLSGQPFEKMGFVIFRKGGEGSILRGKDMTNTALIGSGGMHNYLPLK